MNIALVDLGSLMLCAGRRSTVLPNMALVLRFEEPLTLGELEGEAERLAVSPFGLGRRLTAPRVPGARPRWVPAPEPPPVALAPPQRTPQEMARWLADELSIRHDPERAAGWRLAATTDADGAMVVALTVNHLFGTGRDIATTLYGGDLVGDDAGAGPVNGSSGSNGANGSVQRSGTGCDRNWPTAAGDAPRHDRVDEVDPGCRAVPRPAPAPRRPRRPATTATVVLPGGEPVTGTSRSSGLSFAWRSRRRSRTSG